jgi:hypothetical protein
MNFEHFANYFTDIQATQPAVYDALTKELSPEEQGMINSVFQEAEQKRLEQEATAIAAMQAQQAGN